MDARSGSAVRQPAQPGRAGLYVQQRAGYRAFIPSPLPPDPQLVVENDLQNLLSRGDRALGRLDGSVLTLPKPDLFVFMPDARVRCVVVCATWCG